MSKSDGDFQNGQLLAGICPGRRTYGIQVFLLQPLAAKIMVAFTYPGRRTCRACFLQGKIFQPIYIGGWDVSRARNMNFEAHSFNQKSMRMEDKVEL